VALALRRKGISRVRPLLGGLDAWLDREYSVERLGPVGQTDVAA
jgi:rhodanese-related sulfurtransferase